MSFVQYTLLNYYSYRVSRAGLVRDLFLQSRHGVLTEAPRMPYQAWGN